MLTTMGVNLIRASQVPSVAFRLGTGACRHVVYRTHGLSTTVRPGSRVVFRPHQQPGVRPEVIQPRAAAGPAGDLPSAGRPGSPELDQPRLFRAVSFGDIYFYINVVYWSLVVFALVSGNDVISRFTNFEYYTTAMLGTSVAFAAYHLNRWMVHAGKQLRKQVEFDGSQFLRYSWNAVFWLGFVLWHAVPQLAGLIEWTATPGAIMSLFGLALAISAAFTEGMWAFLGEPQVPRRFTMAGPYAICRHPQALGNMLFLIGASLAGGAVAASAAFIASFLLYHATVVPREEQLLVEAFGEQYEAYRRRTPSYAFALLLLVLLEAVLLWRYYPYTAPLGPISG